MDTLFSEKEQTIFDKTNQNSDITIGITSYKNSKMLKGLLSKLDKEICLEHNYELIIVGDQEATCFAYILNHQNWTSIKTITEVKRKGKPWAINQIIRHSKNEIIVLIDSDVILNFTAICKILKAFNNPNIGAASGKVVALKSDFGIFTYWSDFLCIANDYFRNKKYKNGEFYELAGSLLAFRKQLVNNIPNDTLTDDAVIGILSNNAGYKNKYIREAEVKYQYCYTLREFIRKSRRNCAGLIQIHKRYGVKIRDPLVEFKEFFIFGIMHAKTIKELYAFLFLCFFRLLCWGLAFYDLVIKKKDMIDIWLI